MPTIAMLSVSPIGLPEVTFFTKWATALELNNPD